MQVHNFLSYYNIWCTSKLSCKAPKEDIGRRNGCIIRIGKISIWHRWMEMRPKDIQLSNINGYGDSDIPH
jgi:hypothetical protein